MTPDVTIDGAPAALLPTFELLAGGLVLLGLPVFVAEIVQLRRQGALGGDRIRGMLTSAFCAVPSAVAQLVLAGVLGALYFGAASLTPLSIPTTWATALLCLLLVDLGYYWEHRISHEVNFFWASFHSTHHSADHYDQSVGLRTSFTEYLLNLPALGAHLVLIGAGFHPLLVLGSYGLMLAMAADTVSV